MTTYADCNCDYDAVNDWHKPECAHLISVAEECVRRANALPQVECDRCRAYLLTIQRESRWVNERNGALAFLSGVLHEILRAKTIEDARTFVEMALGHMAEFHAGTWTPGPADDAADWRRR